MKLKTTEQFILDAKQIHGNKYDYSLVEYKGNKIVVKIICDKHGCFEQTPDHHLGNHGCDVCGQEKNKIHCNKTLNTFINESNIKFNNKFDYSKFNYISAFIKSIIICPKHGEFEQTPDGHLHSKYGCCKCAKIEQQKITSKKSKISNKEFIRRANIIHNNKYEYIEKYKGYNVEINIKCPEHGNFSQTPNKHLHDRGCPICGKRPNKETCFIYILYDKKYNLYKIGICKNIKNRIVDLGKKYMKILI